MAWENSKEYDDVMRIIGRNRKFVLGQLAKLTEEGETVSYAKAKEVVAGVLESGGVNIEDAKIRLLLKFADRGGVMDSKLIGDVFRERLKRIDAAPR